jgi:formylglycine-generating enzyme required for sulfatase activity
VYLEEARTILLDPVARRNHDQHLRAAAIAAATVEFKKLITLAIANKKLYPTDEERLLEAGMNLGLTKEEAGGVVEASLAESGSVRESSPATVVSSPSPAPAAAPAPQAEAESHKDPASEFRRILRMSRLCLVGEDMSDDQRDAMCNLGESLGLTGGQAEDLIDEYLEDVATMPMQMTPPKVVTPPRAAAAVVSSAPAAKPAVVSRPAGAAPVAKPAAPPTATPNPARPASRIPTITPLMRAQEREKYANFASRVGAEMYLVTSGVFQMGSTSPLAQPNEQPITPTYVSRFFISRFPITNAQYEMFDAAHASKRAPWADALHPVVYVSALDAERFCAWLSRAEGRKYRLPTEAEWEYAARGLENRNYPWGEQLDSGAYANFADARSTFAWRDPRIDDGWAQTSPVGSFPKGASPFGLEELAGNVFEWCLDGYMAYKGKEIANPRGPKEGGKRIYRGGSWKSRAASLRATARNFNAPDYSSNDVGFRIVCECE